VDTDPVILWNVILTILVGPVVYWGRAMATEIKRIDVLLNKTREDCS